MSRVVVGRQPIYDRNLEVDAYELLFRGSSDAEGADFRNADAATATVMLHSFLDIGTERVVGKRRAFINCTRTFIVEEDVLDLLTPEKFVIEVLEHVDPAPDVLEGLGRLSKKGFLIALDDYVHDPKMEPLLELADIVKLDCLALGLDGVERHTQTLEPWNVKIVAEKVETHDEFARCRDLGADLFQGYFLKRPQVVIGSKVPSNRLTLLRVLAQINDPDTGVEELGEVIEQDVGIAYALLRHVNSVLYGLPRRVEHLREVVMVLGLDRIRSLASLLLLAQIDDKPKDLLCTALIRAKMCELLADGKDGLGLPTYFTTGLFSTLDALLDADLAGVLTHLPLVEEIKGALLGSQRSALRRSLECVLAYERGNWDEAREIEVPFSDVGGAYLGALDYATEVEGQLSVGV